VIKPSIAPNILVVAIFADTAIAAASHLVGLLWETTVGADV
jgi:hypothetical protein